MNFFKILDSIGFQLTNALLTWSNSIMVPCSSALSNLAMTNSLVINFSNSLMHKFLSLDKAFNYRHNAKCANQIAPNMHCGRKGFFGIISHQAQIWCTGQSRWGDASPGAKKFSKLLFDETLICFWNIIVALSLFSTISKFWRIILIF